MSTSLSQPLQIVEPSHLVTATGKDVFTDSRIIAQQFGKKHFHVLRDIRALLKDVPPAFAKSNFGFSCEINSLANGKPERFYRMTKDGFALLVMGFTGAKSMAIKIGFLDAFNRMADLIRSTEMATLHAFNAAYQIHLNDKRYVSRCAGDMRRWQDVKPLQLAHLERMSPQLALFSLN